MFIYLKKRNWLHRSRHNIIYNIFLRSGSRNALKLGSVKLQPHRVISFNFYLFIKAIRRGVRFSKNFSDLFYNHIGMVPRYDKKVVRGVFF